MKRLLVAGIALLTVPASLLAQKEKEEKDKKDKKDVQHIIITRTGDKDEKTVIEIQGDKIKVNGKDVDDQKDVNVRVNTFQSSDAHARVLSGRNGAWGFNMDNGAISLFHEDENRAMLGVTTEGHEKGAEIKSITKESAAEKAGLKAGDIITRIGDKKIESTDDVTEAIHERKPGDKVTVTVLRDGKEQKLTAELGKWKGIKWNTVPMPKVMDMGQFRGNFENFEPRVFGPGNFYFNGRPRLGLSIQDTEDGAGVKVLDVDDESVAAKAGFRKDDIILSVDETEVKGTEDVTRMLRENREKASLIFKVKRDGKTQNIEVKFPKKLKTADL